MKKKFAVLTALVLLVSLALSACGVTFDGYSHSLEDARKTEKCYAEYDYLFTVEHDDKIIDFLINGGVLRIVKIDTRGESPNKQYNAKSVSSSNIEDSLVDSRENNEYYWIKSGNSPIQVEWLVVSKEFNDSHDSLEGLEFTYKGETLCLCYRFEE